jgi:hypothetical protein
MHIAPRAKVLERTHVEGKRVIHEKKRKFGERRRVAS